MIRRLATFVRKHTVFVKPFLLMETGSHLLLESGDKLLLN